MKIPLKQIAEDCNVSMTTVSRVLNNTGRISSKTRERILNYVEKKETELYTKNFSKKTIGIIVPNIQNEYFSSMVTYIEEYFSKKNHSIILHITSKDIKRKIEALDDLVYRQVSGIIYIGGPKKFYEGSLNNIPMVCIEHSPLLNEQCYSLVTVDNEAGGYLATQELINRDCKRILFLANDGMLKEEKGRYSGYLKALKDNHIQIHDELIFKSTSQKFGIMEAKNAIHYLLAKGIQFDSVFATTDWRGYGVISALNEQNILIPEDVQVIGYDNISIAKYTFPSLSSINVDYELIASHASHHLEMAMNNEKIDNTVTIVPFQLIKRDSTK